LRRNLHDWFIERINTRNIKPRECPRFSIGGIINFDFGDLFSSPENKAVLEPMRCLYGYTLVKIKMDLRMPAAIRGPSENSLEHYIQNVRLEAVYSVYDFENPKEGTVRTFALYLPGSTTYEGLRLGTVTPGKLEGYTLREAPVITSEKEFEAYQKASLDFLKSKNIPIIRAKSKESEKQDEMPKLLQFTKTG